MRSTSLLTALVAILASAMVVAQASAQPPAEMMGRWINPRGSVEVEMRSCGVHLCGRVSWASAEALQDAREAGVHALVGTELLQDYSPSKAGVWQGRVYVPDMGRSFYSRIALTSPDALRVSGCIVGGLICKAQIWRRQP